MKENIKKPYNRAKWDSQNSTYMQIIHFANGKSIVGYSQRTGYEEIRDRTKLLKNLILRMYEKGYLNEHDDKKDVDCIEYHMRQKTGDPYELFFVLYQNYVEWNQDLYRESIDKFLRKFLELKAQGENPYNLLYDSSKSKRLDPLTISTPRFKGRDDLRAHCVRLVDGSIRAIGEVKNFYIKYCEQYLNGYKQLDEAFILRLKN